MNPFEHSLCSDHLITLSEGSHSRRFDLHMFLPVHEPPQFPCANIFSNPLDQGEHREFDHPPEPVLEADEHFLSIGSSWQQSSQRPSSSPLPMISKDDEDRKKKKKISTVTTGESVDPSSTVKSGSSGRWLTSSKMKSTVRKVVNPDRITGSSMLQARDPPQQSMSTTTDGTGSSNKNGGGQLLSCSGTGMIRVCSDCNTTKTPLWRSGPSGPKSLCNACGIRRRKARRAMAAAAAGLVPGAGVGPSSSKLQRKEKMSEGGSSSTMPFKKRCKFVTSAQASKQLHFDDVDILALDLSKNSTGRGLQRVFPQDEKEAAMLLMALSCGLIRG